VNPHAPALQVPFAFGGDVQALPQVPQLLVSLCVATHWPLQFVVPVGQLTAHAPFEQTCPVAHVTPQPPQLALSVWALTQVLPQRVRPVEQLLPQVPLLQNAVPPLCGGAQTTPQAPQFCGSDETDRQLVPHLL
jgi:hypothetical protein